MTHPLEGPVFRPTPPPKGCDVCKPPAWVLRLMRDGRWECTRLDCPHRNYFKEQK